MTEIEAQMKEVVDAMGQPEKEAFEEYLAEKEA
jgi:hypothetical protein